MASVKQSEILALEKRVWDGLVAGDVSVDAELLSADFLGVYESGFSDKAGHCAQLDDGPTVASYRIEDVRLLEPAPGLVLLCYRAAFTRPGAGARHSMYVSSLWKKTGDGWCNLFSQDTATDASLAV